jgi:hypothetical protein
MRTAFGAGVALCVGALSFATSAVAVPASSRAPTSAAQKSFVKVIRSGGPAGGLSNKSLVQLGEGVCSLLKAHSVSFTVDLITGTGVEFLQPRLVKSLMTNSPKYFCPQYVSKVKTGGSLVPPADIVALAPLVPEGSSDCAVIGPSGQPNGFVGVTASIACQLPDLGSTSAAAPCPTYCNSLFAYQFDNAADYAADLNTLNQSKNFSPGNPPAVCPTSNTVDNGTQEWSNNGYPKQSGQILECLTVQTNGTGPNTIPDYLWTLPSKNVIFDSYGYPGMSMQTLDTWWQNHSAPGP